MLGAVPTPELSWVTKTDVTDYIRCPYTFWLLDRKQIRRAETMTPSLVELIEAGRAFEDKVIGGARPIVIEPGSEAEYFQGDHTLVTTDLLFRNDTLRLRGCPDGIVSAHGALEPVEIKRHRRVLRTDIIELAFYWRLLEPVRTRSSEPAGWVYLRAPDGSVVPERIKIAKRAFDDLENAIDGVRQARINGVQPRHCRCALCSGLRREEVQRHVTEVQDVSAIQGVGPRHAAQLADLGINCWDELIVCDAARLADHFQGSGIRGITERMIRQWQAHAQSLKIEQPIWVEDRVPFPVPDEYIAFDLEYNAEAKDIWLIAARAVAEAGDVIFSAWTDLAGNRSAFEALTELLDNHPGLSIVTWNGLSADLPMLEAATARCEMGALAEAVAGRHIDLLAWQRRHLMIPTMDFRLKHISEWAGISRESELFGGLAAEARHRRYMLTGDKKIRDELLDYCRDDVDGLVQLTEYFRELATSGRPENPPPLRDAQEIIEYTFEEPIKRRRREPRRVISRTKRDRILKNIDSMVSAGRMSRDEAASLRAAEGTEAFDQALGAFQARLAKERIEADVAAGDMTQAEADGYIERLHHGEDPIKLLGRMSNRPVPQKD
jgi:predicted RecB family nuclease